MVRVFIFACLAVAIFVLIPDATAVKMSTSKINLLRKWLHRNRKDGKPISPTEKSIRRKLMLQKFLSTCSHSLRVACIPMIGQCGVQSIFKRSIDNNNNNDVTLERVRRSSRRKRTRELDVTCKLCENVCWK